MFWETVYQGLFPIGEPIGLFLIKPYTDMERKEKWANNVKLINLFLFNGALNISWRCIVYWCNAGHHAWYEGKEGTQEIYMFKRPMG